jgi:hypothetical protein
VCETGFDLPNAREQHRVVHASFGCGVANVLRPSHAHFRRNLHKGPVSMATTLRALTPNLGGSKLRETKTEPGTYQSESLDLPKHGAV